MQSKGKGCYQPRVEGERGGPDAALSRNVRRAADLLSYLPRKVFQLQSRGKRPPPPCRAKGKAATIPEWKGREGGLTRH